MKRLLLDTHVVLWWLQGSDRLKDSVVVLLKDATNEVFVSAASVWEIAIIKAWVSWKRQMIFWILSNNRGLMR